MTHTYHISGMTCGNCSKTVQERLIKVSGISDVKVDLEKQEAEITMQQHISTNDLQAALSGTKYTITKQEHPNDPASAFEKEEPVTIKSYLPIFLIFGYITSVTLLIQFSKNTFNTTEWMQHFMAGFFLVFSFFKLLNVKDFAESYKTYDLPAKYIPGYAFVYPFIELSLGISFLLGWNPFLTNLITLIVMGASSIGVIQSVMNKKKIRCACVGAVFNLPMSSITIIEDLLMVGMSEIMLYYLK